MNKARGCFIAFIVIFISGLLIALIVAFPLMRSSSQQQNEQQQEGTQQSDPSVTTYKGGGSGNYLFLGVDARGDLKEFSGRTDTIIILHVSGFGKKDVLISIPRDTRVKLEGHGNAKINAAYVYGGKDMLKQEIYELTGIGISRTMLVNFEGFKNLVDALGGVTITVDEPMHDPLSGADFEPGTYLMDGEMALAFSRCRKTSQGDFDRVDRQKYLLGELMKQKLNASIIGKAPQLLGILNEYTKSDFSTFDYLKLATILLLSDRDFIQVTIPGKSQTIDGVSYVISHEEQVKEFLSDYLK
jgi:LCP family protein required for cell wall assembly